MINYLGFINKELILFTSVYVVVVLVINSIWLHPKGLAPWKEWLIEFIPGRWKWFRSFSALKQAYIAAAGAIGLALLVLFVILYSQVIKIPFYPEKLDESELRNLAIAFIGTITGIGALFGVYLAILKSETTERQTYTEEQGLITDRLNKATEGLGKIDTKEPVIEVRLGALYALERIAQDSLRDHVQIMEILCAYIRHNSPREKIITETKSLREDIKAAITIIGRRQHWLKGKEHLEKETEKGYRLDLRNCDLHGAQLDRANLVGAQLSNANLVGAQLNNAKLRGALLNRTDLSRARLDGADLSRARLNGADLSRARLNQANLTHARLNNVEMTHVMINDANLTNARLINANLMNSDFDYSNLSNAWLMRANMTYTNIIDTNMKNANLKYAFAHMIDFSDCLNLVEKQLEHTFCGKNTFLPKNWKIPKDWPIDDLPYHVFKDAWKQWNTRGAWNELQLSLPLTTPPRKTP